MAVEAGCIPGRVSDVTSRPSAFGLLADTGSGGKLLIERLAIADAPPQELWPFRHLRDRIGDLGQEPPELGVVPAEFVTGAVSVPPDSFAQMHHFVNQVLSGERLKIVVRWHHEASVARSIGDFPRSSFASGRG